MVPTGLNASARTLTANRSLPTGVTLIVMQGAPIIINSGVRFTIYGTIQDCNYQIFDDQNTYTYGYITLTPSDIGSSTFTNGQPIVINKTGHGFRDGEFILVASVSNCPLTGQHWYVSKIDDNSFSVKNTSGIIVNGNGTPLYANDTIIQHEAWGVKFLATSQSFVRPEWWGATANDVLGNQTINNTAFNHAIHNSLYTRYGGYDISTHIAVQLSSGCYYVNGTLYFMSGTVLRGAAMGWTNQLAYGSLIMATATAATQRFIYINSAAGCQIYDLTISGNANYQYGIEISTSGGAKSNNTRISRIHIGGFAAWAIYADVYGMMTYIDNIEANPISNGGGVHLYADSKIAHSRITGPDSYTNDTSVGIWASCTMVQNCIIEVCNTCLALDNGPNHVQGNWMRQCVNGISSTSTGYAQATIIGNQIGGQTSIYTPSKPLYRCLIIGNLISGNVGFDTQGFTDSVITGNDLTYNGKCIFNVSSIYANGPGQFYNNIGIDVSATPYLLTHPTIPYGAMALSADKFTTNNTVATNYLQFFSSLAVGRKLEITLGDTNTTFSQFATRQSGQTQAIYAYTPAAGWSTNNYSSSTFKVFSSPAAVGDCLYVGNTLPLVGIKFWINTTSIGNTIVTEYYDGYEWVPLTVSMTNLFDKPGYQSCTWYPPPKSNFLLYPSVVTVDATAKTFTLASATDSWLQVPFPLHVGDYIITSGFSAAGIIRKLAGTPTAGGTGYSVGDVLTITTGSGNATVRVDAVSGGVVKAVSLVSAGTAYSVGNGQATAYGGTGTGCTVNILSSGSNGKFQVTAVTNNVLSVSGATNLVNESKNGTSFIGAGWKAEPTFTSYGLPWGNSDGYTNCYFMRFRVTVAGGGQCTIGDGSKPPQYSYLYLSNGDFGPTTDIAKKETIVLREQNGVFVEQERTTVAKPGTLFTSLGIAAGTTAGKMKSTAVGWLTINGVTYQKAITDNLWSLTALATGSGEYCKVALCLDISGTASVVKGNVAASQAAAVIPAVSKSVVICGVVELGPNYAGGALGSNAFYDTPGMIPSQII